MHNILKTIYNKFLLFRVPKRIRKKFIKTSLDYEDKLKSSLIKNYFDGPEDIKDNDLKDHLYNRTLKARVLIVPWMSRTLELKDKRILEVGCGTGSSSVAFCEQGAHVTGIDLDQGSLEVARFRAELLNLDIKYKESSANQIESLDDSFEIIIYYATLEHMTIEERIDSLRQAFRSLEPGGYLIIIEAPNRLWIEDTHTSELPFFQWLPDDLAYLYSQKSPKETFRDNYLDKDYKYILDFLRRGRGVSYHEFELSFGNLKNINIVSSLNRIVYSGGLVNTLIYKKLYKAYLKKQKDIPSAYFEEYLDLIIKKV